MRLFTSLIAMAAIVMSAGSAFAAANWSVSASTSDGSPLTAITPGAQIILDIGLTTTGPELLGISGSVNDYDTNVTQPAAGGHTIAASLLHQVCFPSAGCFNGVANLESGLRVENGVEGAGQEATFVSILSVSAALGDGSIDTPFPQFQVIMDALNPGSTVLRVGTFADYAGAYAGGDNIVNNQAVAITVVPEPGTALLMGLGLAGLASRRR